MPAKSANEVGLSYVPGEPQFLLLARDPQFAPLIETWVAQREADIRCGARPASDIAQVTNAKIILAEGAQWRLKNNGVWRKFDQNGHVSGDIAEQHKGDVSKYYGLTGQNTDGPLQTVTAQFGDGSGPAPLPKLSPEEQAKASATVQLPSPHVEAQAASFASGGVEMHVQPVKPWPHIQSQSVVNTSIHVQPPVFMHQPIASIVYKAIEEASTKVNVPLPILLAFADIESGFDPNAASKAGTSAGLYQFTHDTWTEMVNNYGVQYKITADMIFDPLSNATMAAARIKQYSSYLTLHHVPVDAGNMYCLHFLGMTGGVKLILCATGKSAAYPPNIVASKAFPIAALANPNIFGELTLLQVYNKLYDKAQRLADAYQSQPVAVDDDAPTVT